VDRTLSLSTPADLLAAVPYLIGFHPSESVVIMGLRGPELIFELRGDLPAGPAGIGPPSAGDLDEVVDYYTHVVWRQGADAALLIGYGPPARVTPLLVALRTAMARKQIQVLEMLRVQDGRYWSYLCTMPGCCPPEGTPYDVRTSQVAVQAVLSGREALPSRAELERRLAPVRGAERAAMREATERASWKLGAVVGLGTDTVLADGLAALEVAGAEAVDGAIARQRRGRRLDDDEVAWLTVALGYIPVRDHAWQRISGDLGRHVALWTDVLRRAEPELAAPPAALLAFAAWRCGEGAVASIALARALEADPDYTMAQLLDQALRGGLSPMEWEAVSGARRGDQ
jgi:hypothetical protein